MSPRNRQSRVTPLRLVRVNEAQPSKAKPLPSALATHRATCCAGCKTVTLREALTAWESLDGQPSQFDGRLVCERCESQLIADEHDNTRDGCDCRHCTRDLAERNAAQVNREAATYGGLRPDSLALLGLTTMLTGLGLPSSDDDTD